MRPVHSITRSSTELSRFLGLASEIPHFDFSGLTNSTKHLEAGDLFVALQGERSHGVEFIDQAISAGAVAVLTDAAGASRIAGDIPVVQVENPRFILGDLAAWFYNAPFRALHAVGITGTNGKTTTASLVHQLWELSNRESGFIGTVGIQIGRERLPAQFTTPESPELQATVASMVERSIHQLVMEVSSHAIAQRRISGTYFSHVAFTNLTQDHLDFHGSMENYFATKAKLFTTEYAAEGFINIDDPYGKLLVEFSEIPVHTLSRDSRSATWHFDSYQISGGGYDVSIRGVGGILIEGHLPLVGGHNLDNALMAIALAVESGIDPLVIASEMNRLRGPEGRLEKIDIGQNFLALVDYAHTPDAVKRVLAAVREITTGRVIAVLGCGGDRDASKRPLMGKALVAGSDFAVMTSDNPRSEDPDAILAAMSSSVTSNDAFLVESDRRGAIAIAVAEAQPGDVVIILGKGHEVGQEIAGRKSPFDDRIELARAIEQLS